MKTSTTGINLIKKYESCSLSPYADANGYPTVGWGHLLTKDRTYPANKSLSDADAKYELKLAGLSNTSSITQSKADQLFVENMAQKVTNAFTFTLAGDVRVKCLVDRRNKEMDLFCKGLKYSYNKIPY